MSAFSDELAATQKRYDDALAACKSMMAVVAPESTVLVLDRYERDNLLALLKLIYATGGEGPSCLATGDWAGQLYWKIAERGFDPAIHKPNWPPEKMLDALLVWARGKLQP